MECSRGLVILLLAVLAACSLPPAAWAASAGNNQPVIGILAQAPSESLSKYGDEYLMSEYVKYLEMAGASPIVVKGGQSKDYYLQVFKRINGVLFPGGAADVLASPYARSGKILYQLALDANDRGDYFPVWGTCLGFEMLTALTAGKNLLNHTDASNLPLPLKLLPSFRESRLFGRAPIDIIYYLTHEKVTANFHKYCLSTETYQHEESLHKFYRVISVNKGRQGVQFVSTMEAYHYPIYGVQWHPEKNIFTRRIDQNIDHSAHAVEVSQYLANFFVSEARKSSHRFASDEERSRAVIENDHRVFLRNNYIEDFFFNVTKGRIN